MGPKQRDRNAAVAWAKAQGHSTFTVQWANGETCDWVKTPAPAKKKATKASAKSKGARR